MSQNSNSRICLWRTKDPWHCISKMMLFLIKEVSILVLLGYSEHSYSPVFRPENYTFKTISTNWSTASRWKTEPWGSVNNKKYRTTEENVAASTEEADLWDDPGNVLYFKVIILLNLSNNACEAWSLVLTFILHIRKLALRKTPYLGFHNSSVTRWDLNSGPSWCSLHYNTLPSSERESFTHQEPKRQRR